MNYRYFDIGSKKIRVNFLSTGMGSSDYNVELCMNNKPGTRVRRSTEDVIIRAHEWGCNDAGLTVEEAINAVEMFRNEEHGEYLQWLNKLSPEQRAIATA